MEERMKYIVECITFTALYSFLIYAIFSAWSFDLLWIIHPSNGGKLLFAYAITLVIVFRILFLLDRLNFVRKKEEEEMKLIKRKARIHYIDLHIGLLEHEVFSVYRSKLETYDKEELRTMFYSIYSNLHKIRLECNEAIK